MNPLLFMLLALIVFLVTQVDSRNPYLQPFSRSSIWNLPIGKGAKYVPADLTPVKGKGIVPDGNFITMTPNAPVVPFVFSNAGWDRHKQRCIPTNKTDVITHAPLLDSFIMPGTNSSLGRTPNACGGFLAADNRTVRQTHPVARCKAGGVATTEYHAPSVDLYGDGTLGAFGGSGLSSIGGTVRYGEMMKNSPPMRHALKVEFNAKTDYYNPGHGPYFRWPAVTADGYASEKYGGHNAAVQPGSLLALNSSIDINDFGLKTEPAKKLAWTLQNYGAYIVADAAQSVWQGNFEWGTHGWFGDQFNKEYGYPLYNGHHGTSNDWTDDCDKIFTNIAVVDNWNERLYNEVVKSDGAMGAGGGEPLQPWAEPITPP